MSDASIAVAMCTYNGERFVAEQLRSIARQTRLPDSLVVLDDQSTDATVAVVRGFAAAAPFPVVIEVNETNLGYRKNFERAISRCSGDIIVLADQDDVWYPHKLATLEAAFRSAPGADLVFSDADVVGAALEPLGYRLWESVDFTRGKRARMDRGEALEVLLRRNVVTGATMAFRARHRELLLPLPDGAIHDAWIALVLSVCSRVVAIPEPLIAYRQHEANQIGASRQSLAGRLGEAKTLQRETLRTLSRQLTELQDRLRAHGAGDGVAHRVLHETIEHLQTRIEMPSARTHRLPVVCRELVNGRYSRCANGLSSAIRDLVI